MMNLLLNFHSLFVSDKIEVVLLQSLDTEVKVKVVQLVSLHQYSLHECLIRFTQCFAQDMTAGKEDLEGNASCMLHALQRQQSTVGKSNRIQEDHLFLSPFPTPVTVVFVKAYVLLTIT